MKYKNITIDASLYLASGYCDISCLAVFFSPLGNTEKRNLAGEQRRTLVALPTFKMKGQRWSLVGGGDL